jgi:hypothetical protein
VVASPWSPPDMGWFPVSMAVQGRPDLTHEVMRPGAACSNRRNATLRRLEPLRCHP